MTKTRQNNLLTRVLTVAIAIVSTLAMSSPANAQFFSKKTQDLLPEEQAFSVTAVISDSGLIKVNWSIADDYYMYRDRFSIEVASSETDSALTNRNFLASASSRYLKVGV